MRVASAVSARERDVALGEGERAAASLDALGQSINPRGGGDEERKDGRNGERTTPVTPGPKTARRVVIDTV